jgi:erythromycin esterase-like protein
MTATVEDFASAVDAATVLRLFPAQPRLLALGEPVHGEGVLLRLRNGLFRQLVEEEGYRTIALESDCLRGVIVDDYVTAGAGTLDEVTEHGFSHKWFNASEGNRELVRWMREYNDGRSAAEQVRFAGFDGPLTNSGVASPRPVMTALHAYLAARVDAGLLPCTAQALDRLVGADGRWTEPAAMMDPSRSVGQTAEAEQLREVADELAALLVAQAPHLIATSSADDWDRARMYGRTATAMMWCHFWMADTSPSRVARLLSLRESMMAGNLLAIAERGPGLANGHNGHLQRNQSSMRHGSQLVEWSSAGMTVSARLGGGYALLFTALGALRHRGIGSPPRDTIEGVLYAVPRDQFVVDARLLAAAVAGLPLVHREPTWDGYSPLDPAGLATHDAIVYVNDASAS